LPETAHTRVGLGCRIPRPRSTPSATYRTRPADRDEAGSGSGRVAGPVRGKFTGRAVCASGREGPTGEWRPRPAGGPPRPPAERRRRPVLREHLRPPRTRSTAARSALAPAASNLSHLRPEQARPVSTSARTSLIGRADVRLDRLHVVLHRDRPHRGVSFPAERSAGRPPGEAVGRGDDSESVGTSRSAKPGEVGPPVRMLLRGDHHALSAVPAFGPPGGDGPDGRSPSRGPASTPASRPTRAGGEHSDPPSGGPTGQGGESGRCRVSDRGETAARGPAGPTAPSFFFFFFFFFFFSFFSLALNALCVIVCVCGFGAFRFLVSLARLQACISL